MIKIYNQFLNNQADNIFNDSELCQIIVEDNGIGFEEKYLNRIFNVFQLIYYLYHRGRYANNSSLPHLDLILLDLNMPRISGLEALKEIKNDPQLRRIPVVILSTSRG